MKLPSFKNNFKYSFIGLILFGIISFNCLPQARELLAAILTNPITVSNFATSSISDTGFTASIDFSGDDNANAAATLYYCNATDSPGCDPEGGSSAVMSRNGSGFPTGWNYRKTITIQSGQVEVTEAFPVLISVTDADLKYEDGGHVLQADGYDIIFVDAENSALLDFEIESWNPATGELQAWVLVDVSADDNKVIYMYYGNSNAIDESDAAGVWDSSFVGVWHMNEDPTDSDPAFKDSAGSNDGTDYGDMIAEDQVAGQINGSLDFDGGG